MCQAQFGQRFFLSYRVSCVLLASILSGCAGHQELGLVAESLKTTTPLISARVGDLRAQQVGLTVAYNELRSQVLAEFGRYQERLCEGYAGSSRVSLYQGHVAALKALQEQSQETVDSIPDAVDKALADLNVEIDRQRELAERQGRIGSAQPLPGQYSDIVRMALLSERRRIRLRGTIDAINAYQAVVVDAVAALETYVTAQEAGIVQTERECRARTDLRDALRKRLDREAVSPVAQYELLIQYLAHVANVANAIELYVDTNAVFGDNGLFRLLLAEATRSTTTIQQSDAGSDSSGALVGNVLPSAIAATVSSFVEAIDGTFLRFGLVMILREAGLDDIANSLEASLRDTNADVARQALLAIDQAKSEADSALSGSSNTGD